MWTFDPAGASVAGARIRSRTSRPRTPTSRRLILVVVLVMITLLPMLAAGYTFLVRSESPTVHASINGLHARMSADSGFQRALSVIREPTRDLAKWYDNRDVFHGGLVYAPNDLDENGNMRADAIKESAANRSFGGKRDDNT